jgi:hypothetical protein
MAKHSSERTQAHGPVLNKPKDFKASTHYTRLVSLTHELKKKNPRISF